MRCRCHAPAHQSFFGYDTDKDLKVWFLVTQVIMKRRLGWHLLSQASFWYYIDYRMVPCCLHRYHFIVCVIQKEGLACASQTFFCLDNDKDLRTCFLCAAALMFTGLVLLSGSQGGEMEMNTYDQPCVCYKV